MSALDEVQLVPEHAAIVLHLLMVGVGRGLLELDDDVDRGAVMAAFEGIKILGKLVLLAVAKGQTSDKQRNQAQDGEASAPRRRFEETVAGGLLSICKCRRGHEVLQT